MLNGFSAPVVSLLIPPTTQEIPQNTGLSDGSKSAIAIAAFTVIVVVIIAAIFI